MKKIILAFVFMTMATFSYSQNDLAEYKQQGLTSELLFLKTSSEALMLYTMDRGSNSSCDSQILNEYMLLQRDYNTFVAELITSIIKKGGPGPFFKLEKKHLSGKSAGGKTGLQLERFEKIENRYNLFYNHIASGCEENFKAKGITDFIPSIADVFGVVKSIKEIQKGKADALIGILKDFSIKTYKQLQDEVKPSADNTAIGSIVASYLNFEQFSAITENNKNSTGGIWTPGKSRYAPCDGRSVVNSKLSSISGLSNVPDLRGVFLRGLNVFDREEVTPVASDNADPDSRLVGTYQADAFQGHKHFSHDALVIRGDKDLPNQPDQRPNQKYSNNSAGVHDAGYGKPRISIETRPKNVAVYYYIKIN